MSAPTEGGRVIGSSDSSGSPDSPDGRSVLERARRRRTESSLLAPAGRVGLLEIAGMLALTGAVTLAVGPPGVAVGALAILAWFALGIPAAVTIATLALVPLAPSSPQQFAILTAGLLAPVVAPTLRGPAPLEGALAVLVAGAGLAGLSWGLLAAGHPIWLAGLAVLVVLTLVLYVIRRLALVWLGAVPTTSADSEDHPSAGDDDDRPSAGDDDDRPKADAGRNGDDIP